MNVGTLFLRRLATALRTSLPVSVFVFASPARVVPAEYATFVPEPAAVRAMPSVEIPAFQPITLAAIGLTSMNAVAPNFEVN